jgi:hypothetical protein
MNEQELFDFVQSMIIEMDKIILEEENATWQRYLTTDYVGTARGGTVKVVYKNGQFATMSWPQDVSQEALPDLLCVAATNAVYAASDERQRFTKYLDKFAYDTAQALAKRASDYIHEHGGTDEDLFTASSIITGVKSGGPSGSKPPSTMN